MQRECIDCGTVRDAALFTRHGEICNDCHAEVEQDWGGDHVADTQGEVRDYSDAISRLIGGLAEVWRMP